MASKRLQQESFRKRKNNFLRRGHEISDRYNVGVWLCIQKSNGQLYIYNSDPARPDWPPSSTQLVGCRNSCRRSSFDITGNNISSAYHKDERGLPVQSATPQEIATSYKERFSAWISV
jgi:hypothetical protein